MLNVNDHIKAKFNNFSDPSLKDGNYKLIKLMIGLLSWAERNLQSIQLFIVPLSMICLTLSVSVSENLTDNINKTIGTFPGKFSFSHDKLWEEVWRDHTSLLNHAVL